MVLKEPVTLAPAQIAAFRKLIGSNARPIQPLAGRTVQESR
jgi:carbonic anhydrase